MPKDGLIAPFIINYAINTILIGGIIILPISRLTYSIYETSRKATLLTILSFFCVLICLTISFFSIVPYKQYQEIFENNQYTHSEFFKKHFVYNDSNVITASIDKPKNLIFIIMESMENSFIPYIPEITNLEQEGYNFSSSDIFGGGYEVNGSDFTIAATISMTTGIPLVTTVNFGDAALPAATSIYDILHDHGYKNVFIQGSDANFSNTKPFVLTHGIDQLYDVSNLPHQDASNSFKALSYNVGITDKTIFETSKKVLDTLSKEKAFSLTITTIETHYPHGFYNNKCEDKPENLSEESQFKATLRCASKNIQDFVNWLKQQSYYENTEIVIVGDHLFKGKIMLPANNADRRWINLFLNPGVNPKQTKNRHFSSVDMAPTILESLGFNISTHRMGFGTSLYSDKKNLIEDIGQDSLSRRFFLERTSIEYNALNIPNR